MNKNNVIQFIKDGLVGLVVMCLIYGLLWVAMLLGINFLGMLIPASFMFMPHICLTVFISVGISGRFIENIIPRKNWGKPILKMLGVSWLVALFATFPSWFISSSISNVSEVYQHHNFHHSIYQAFSAYSGAIYAAFSSLLQGADFTFYFYMFITGGAIGILLGFVSAYLAAVVFNPQKRLYRIFIPALASIFMAIGILPLGWMFTLFIYPAQWPYGFYHLLWSI